MKILILLSFLCYSRCLEWEYNIGGNRVPKLDRFNGMCRGSRDTKITFEEHGLKLSENKLKMNFTINVKEDVNPPLELALNIQRCRSKENLDTCENFFNFKTKRYCQLLTSESELWNPFFNSIEPKWRCPIKKGLYHSINGEFDVRSVLLFPVDGWFWRINGDMLNEKQKKILCIVVEAKVYAKKN